jgi:hypothetical protein
MYLVSLSPLVCSNLRRRSSEILLSKSSAALTEFGNNALKSSKLIFAQAGKINLPLMLNLKPLNGGNVFARKLHRKLDGLNVAGQAFQDQGGIDAGKVIPEHVDRDAIPRPLEVRVIPKPNVDRGPRHSGLKSDNRDIALKSYIPSGIQNGMLLVGRHPFRFRLYRHV